MCGVVGYWSSKGVANAAVAEHMALQIKSRGPDDSGAWIDEAAGLALAHRRLSIIDLSPAGHQPMVSPCGRYVLTFNGEIYNHADLRIALEAEGGHFDWRGHSDTETLLAALRSWGIDKTLHLINGMFAFALWDARERTLLLARDRMGEKPLYYGRSGNTFLFASELKALVAHPEWRGDIDRSALTLYLRHNCVPAPWSIYRGIAKLPPAHYVVVRDQGRAVGDSICYWDLASIAEEGARQQADDGQSLTDELEALMLDAVGKRMAADVPLGAFLSGGYDSSTVVALMQAQSERPVKTFSIGFQEKAYDEARHAKCVAEHLGTDHTELCVTPEQAMRAIPDLPIIYDEPFSDSSQIPTYLVSRLARRHVTVSLSGDGGDELFCGYNRYATGYRVWQNLRRLPPSTRKALSWACRHAPGKAMDVLQRRLPQRMQVSNLSNRLPKLAEVLAYSDGQSYYQSLVSHWKNPDQIVLDATEPETLLKRQDRIPNLPGLREKMMYLDMVTYLPDDILTKLDRASMANSLEARVPLLDHRLVEFAWRVPTACKIRDGKAKWLLRQVLYRYVPPTLMERPKAGFGVPIDAWLVGPLREWAEELLAEGRLREEGFFNPPAVRKLWHDHKVGKQRWHHHLWDVLMFQAWLEHHQL